MDWLLDPFALTLQQNALWGGLLTSLTTSLVGTWVVLRGMSFMGDALVHGVIPGVAAAAVLGLNPSLGAAVAALVMIMGINLVHRQTTLMEDTGIGLLFVGMLAFGVVLISRSESYIGALHTILFGEVLGVTNTDIFWLTAMALVAIIASLLFYRPFLVLSLHGDKAEMLGMHPRWGHFLMLTLITLTVVAAFQTVGTLLVLGMLIGPPAVAALVAHRVPTIMAVSVLVGMGSVVVGLVISYHYDTAGAATISLLPVVGFFVLLGGRAIRDGLVSHSVK